jgi:hypothetical protein
VKRAGALGVVAAVAITVNLNLLAARFYDRWDLTREALYSLSEPTLRTLHGLAEPLEVTLLLGRSDPLNPSLRQLLTAYGAETDQLRVRQLDPEQHPAEFSALQKKYGIVAGQTQDGQAVTDASLLITQGERHWFVTSDDLLHIDPDGERARPQLEQALTEGIANVLVRARSTVCFSSGHGELGPFDAGPEGLAELRNRIEKNNFEVEERPLGGPRKGGPGLDGCRVLVIAGPRLRFDPADVDAVVSATRAGTSVFGMISPAPAEHDRLDSLGLDALAELAAASFGGNLVLETDAARRVPRGVGEVFFAKPRAHAVTHGLTKGDQSVFDVLVSEAQTINPRAPADAVLETTEQAVALDSLKPILERRADLALDQERSRRVLAVAHELPQAPGAAPTRLVLVGSATVAQNQAALYGNRLFVENALAWVAARPTLVSVPEKPAREIGLSLSQESLGEVMRYVLIYMPATAALLGAFVLLRRRAIETRSRKRPGTSAESPDATRS